MSPQPENALNLKFGGKSIIGGLNNTMIETKQVPSKWTS